MVASEDMNTNRNLAREGQDGHCWSALAILYLQQFGWEGNEGLFHCGGDKKRRKLVPICGETKVGQDVFPLKRKLDVFGPFKTFAPRVERRSECLIEVGPTGLTRSVRASIERLQPLIIFHHPGIPGTPGYPPVCLKSEEAKASIPQVNSYSPSFLVLQDVENSSSSKMIQPRQTGKACTFLQQAWSRTASENGLGHGWPAPPACLLGARVRFVKLYFSRDAVPALVRTIIVNGFV
ncbi:hypothetical protein FA13DRAFT_1851956 [Coprinellus micaceus]|uniref:Uncharacterized protein n=1 Tax=Coprinellus micaceus TaxID=71717 RepID=A0A4Y7TAQ5_COPMI|nr:hypothetical protein FA13DRAFT_1851956 [Coprinellus micaceus]